MNELMIGNLKGLARRFLPASLVAAIARFVSTPRVLKNWPVWAIRRALQPLATVHCWAISHSGCHFYLGDDPVDDLILQDVLYSHIDLYFPPSSLPISANPLILDIGAHHGFVAIEMLRRNPTGYVVAIEPNPRAVRLLKKNLQRNNLLDRVEIVAAGVGDLDGLGLLRLSATGSWGDSTSLQDTPPGSASGQVLRIKTLTLSSILKGRQPHIVKCNAEGAEFLVFPQLFALGILPCTIILMAHAAYGPIPTLLALLRSKGYIVKDLGSGAPEQPHFHCTLVASSA